MNQLLELIPPGWHAQPTEHPQRDDRGALAVIRVCHRRLTQGGTLSGTAQVAPTSTSSIRASTSST
jgi:hypothetical protein